MIDVILPARNEAAALPAVLSAFPTGFRPIVVDNGSSDDTAAVARAHGALVVAEERPGFGSACFAGLTAATAQIVAFMDADASFDAADLPRVTGPVAAGEADLVLGARVARAGAWPWHARGANRALAGLVRRRTGLRLHDLGPMRAARRADLLSLTLRDRRSGWPLEMVLRAHAEQWRIAEVDVAYHPRVGRSKVTGTVRGTLTAVVDMGRFLR
ncbi:MAG: glycosyltransferase family 2 protein [Dermatophilaceae bacterium]|nr:glycosyltransferase family 2 protein [Candidatus Lutibacillus vidarii]